MLQYIPNIFKKIGRKQWCFIAILSTFTLMGAGDSYHQETEGSSPVPTEQFACLGFSGHLSIFELELETDSLQQLSNEAVHFRQPGLLRFQCPKIKTAYTHLSTPSIYNSITTFLPQKIPSNTEKEDEPLSL